uniref:Uncharacterized protein n=1 Tax=viral metagenome TaxID=1070528 RepID=A0A2V0RA63_9ZZZZ
MKPGILRQPLKGTSLVANDILSRLTHVHPDITISVDGGADGNQMKALQGAETVDIAKSVIFKKIASAIESGTKLSLTFRDFLAYYPSAGAFGMYVGIGLFNDYGFGMLGCTIPSNTSEAVTDVVNGKSIGGSQFASPGGGASQSCAAECELEIIYQFTKDQSADGSAPFWIVELEVKVDGVAVNEQTYELAYETTPGAIYPIWVYSKDCVLNSYMSTALVEVKIEAVGYVGS